MVHHTAALSCSAITSSEQAHNHTSRHHSFYQHHPSREFPPHRASHPQRRQGDLPAVQPRQMQQRSRVLLCPQVLGHRLWWRPLRQDLPTCCTSGSLSSSELTPFYNTQTLCTNYAFNQTRPGLPGCLTASTMVYPLITLALFLPLDHITYLLHMHIQMW